MKLRVLLVGIAVLVVSAPAAMAEFSDIFHSLYDGSNIDTHYAWDASMSKYKLDISHTGAGDIFPTTDPSNELDGYIYGTTTCTLETWLDSVGGDGDAGTNDAFFLGGTYTITFDWKATAGGSYTTATMSGPIDALQLIGGNGVVDGLANWTASTKSNLPASWNDGGGLSGFDSITIEYTGEDLRTFDWTGGGGTGASFSGETIYTIVPFPVPVPEPVTMLLLASGTALLGIRRRHA